LPFRKILANILSKIKRYCLTNYDLPRSCWTTNPSKNMTYNILNSSCFSAFDAHSFFRHLWDDLCLFALQYVVSAKNIRQG
jgi:hypothetical protein